MSGLTCDKVENATLPPAKVSRVVFLCGTND